MNKLKIDSKSGAVCRPPANPEDLVLEHLANQALKVMGLVRLANEVINDQGRNFNKWQYMQHAIDAAYKFAIDMEENEHGEELDRHLERIKIQYNKSTRALLVREGLSDEAMCRLLQKIVIELDQCVANLAVIVSYWGGGEFYGVSNG